MKMCTPDDGTREVGVVDSPGPAGHLLCNWTVDFRQTVNYRRVGSLLIFTFLDSWFLGGGGKQLGVWLVRYRRRAGSQGCMCVCVTETRVHK